MSKRAVIYPRVSMDKTGEGLSTERQEKACRALCEARGWEVVAVHADTQSAWNETKERPGWEKVLAMVGAGQVDVIVAWHFDRITRSMTTLESLIMLVDQAGVGIATATGDIDLTTDTGRMVARILAAVARAEVERKAARQVLANDQRAAQGLPWTGGPRAFGYEAGGTSLVAREAEAFRWAAQAALDGRSLRAIGRELEARGCSSTRSQHSASGAGWTHSGVAKMLCSPRYAGIRVHKGVEIGAGSWPAIIDLDTHLALKRLLDDPSRDRNPGAPRNSRKPTNLLSLIARCAVCGDTLIAGRGGADPRYRCRSSRGCVVPPRGPLDDAVAEAVLGLLSTRGFLESLLPANDERAAAGRRQLDRLHRRLSLLNDDFAEGVYDDNEEEYRRTTRELREKVKAQKQTLNALADTSVFTGLAVGSDAVIAQWATLELERQRIIIDRLLSVKVRPVGPRQRWDADKHLDVKRARPLAAVEN